MSCRNYDPCLDSKLNQIGSYASVARQSAQSATASAAAADADATAAAASAAAAAASAEIAGIYLGPFATPPTVDNQGGPLQEGMLYYNTGSNTLFVWNGSSWSAIQDDEIYLGGFAAAPVLNNQGLPLVNGNMYWNTVSSRLFTWNGSAWIQAFGQNYLGGFAVAPTLNNQGLPLVLGNLYWNSVTNNLWAYNGVAWIVTTSNMPTGGGTNRIFYLNDNQVTADYTIPAGKNAMSAGPITVNPGVTVTVPPGQSWTIV
jgi:hypothetical protein